MLFCVLGAAVASTPSNDLLAKQDSEKVLNQTVAVDELSQSYLELDCQLALLDGPACSPPPFSGTQLSHFTPLPKTPEKLLDDICRSMVKQSSGAMVAFPSVCSAGSCSHSTSVVQSVTSLLSATMPANNIKQVDDAPQIVCEDSTSLDAHLAEDEELETEDVQLFYSPCLTLFQMNIPGEANVYSFTQDDLNHTNQEETPPVNNSADVNNYSSPVGNSSQPSGSK